MTSPCHRCGKPPRLSHEPYCVTVVCDNCYGWTPDEGHESEIVNVHVFGRSYAEAERMAVQEWDKMMEENG